MNLVEGSIFPFLILFNNNAEKYSLVGTPYFPKSDTIKLD